MGGGEAKHQVASLAVEAQEPPREIGCQGLAGRAEEGDAGHDQGGCVRPRKAGGGR